jgi:hypothetical protein
MKNAQPSISIARTKTPTRHAARTNQAAASPINDRATPTAKKAAMPSSASTSAVAFETDMNDSRVVVDSTTTLRFDLGG